MANEVAGVEEYKYNLEELVDNLYDDLSDLMGGSSKNILSKPVVNIMNKRTIVSNMQQIADQLKRDYQEIHDHFAEELHMSISQTGEGHMVIVGIVRPPIIEKQLKTYVAAHVQCIMCKSIDTYMKKESRISYLCCNKCKAIRSVK